jgi:hypothetical protein
VAAVLVAAVAGAGCGPAEQAGRGARSGAAAAVAPPQTVQFLPHPVGRPIQGRPWIAHVNPVDLDRDGLIDIIVCDAQANEVTWIRQVARGQFEERVLAEGIAGPVRTEVVDLDQDGDLDIVVASMGQVFPNNAKIGAVVWLENDGRLNFTPRTLLKDTSRVTDVRAGDFNGNGRIDLALAQFGYDQGEVAWLENRGGGRFDRHVLLPLAGAIDVLVADFNGDQTLDIVSNIAQQWEEVHFFANDGQGRFTSRVIHGSTNEDFGSSGIARADVNGNGRSDIIFTNGDGFDYAEPGARPWHGVQWLENLGNGYFRYHRVADMAGAYSPVGVDLNGDGHLDIVACSGFNDWRSPRAVSLVAFLNDGQQRFTPVVLAREPTHLMTVAAAQLDGEDQPPVLITGGFHAYPPYDRMSRVLLWRKAPSP